MCIYGIYNIIINNNNNNNVVYKNILKIILYNIIIIIMVLRYLNGKIRYLKILKYNINRNIYYICMVMGCNGIYYYYY